MSSNPYSAPTALGIEPNSPTPLRWVGVALCAAVFVFSLFAVVYNTYRYVTGAFAPSAPQTAYAASVAIFTVSAVGSLYSSILFMKQKLRFGLVAGTLAGLLAFPGARLILGFIYD
ncbi:hypothetical protein Poly51_35820 [Rubripirellula tenax]|uniref:Uncharacterized protein n=1 Tax=Rubripirellula tenax TaxID=2528015 RepID=A0A5C6F0P8_9BACT|nr:hypothetical protein [Rubripirellula tenax]TWU54862.1 hypothetical protein Poly51_35820 [Rubripirellula tenax]